MAKVITLTAEQKEKIAEYTAGEKAAHTTHQVAFKDLHDYIATVAGPTAKKGFQKPFTSDDGNTLIIP